MSRLKALLLPVFRGQYSRFISWYIFLLGPWFCFAFVEILNQNPVLDTIRSAEIVLNLAWYYLFFCVSRLLLGRLRRAAAAASVLCFLVGLVNYYTLRFRGRIIFPADIFSIQTAVNVSGGYDFTPTWHVYAALLVLVVYLFLLWLCPPQPHRVKVKLPTACAAWCACLSFLFIFFCTDMLPSLSIYPQQWFTQKLGFVLNFTTIARSSITSAPEGYSRDLVLDIAQSYDPAEPDDTVVRPTNIIAIMNESFADYSIYEGFDPSEDPLPFFHSLEENTIKGWLTSSAYGGGTASIEFEYLSGFHSIFQPDETVAYHLYVDENTPTMVPVLERAGYTTTALHPYKPSGWNRDVVYEYFGFDNIIFDEDIDDPEYARNYISDRTSYQAIIDITEREESSFVLNVTMQNHSAYNTDWPDQRYFIDEGDCPEDLAQPVQQYLSLLRESDDALRELIAYYENCDEPTMIVFWGDHQPSFSHDFHGEIFGIPYEEWTTNEFMKLFIVPFFIWTNYDIEEQSGVFSSTNFLGVKTAELAGLPMTGFMNFLSTLSSEIPLISRFGITDTEDVFYEEAQYTDHQKYLLEQYRMLNYCGLMDYFDDMQDFFFLPAVP